MAIKRINKDDGGFQLPHPELDRRPWLSVIGLILSILGWLAIFILPKGEKEVLTTQALCLMGVAVVSGLMCWFGRKQAPGMSLVGLVVAISLFLILGCSLIGSLS